ncbi:delphilin-like [Dorcoceras hygrometricum]|uniref:Delphilin-like n=1 Tax=Dorcoceras hygrometricum TaxID=472368 RepID=A0A2Z7A605_9LAMI|nr:delphilin-like [Dorcoceras hygrometricum]
MASSLINNTIQIFDSVYGMADEGMVQMFKALESSGLHGFLGCSSAIYEADLVEFFQNASVRDGKVVSAVQGKAVEISDEMFAGTFDFPTEGLTEMTDVPKDLVFDARSAFSMGVTHERFLMMSAIHGGVEVNCGRLLFNIFKDMVTPVSKQARGFVTVGTYVSKNKNITVEEVADEPVVKKSAPKRRPAPAVVELAAKKKRTIVGRPAPTEKDSAMVPMVQNPEPISVVPDATPRAQRRRTLKRKFVMQEGSNDEIVDSIIHQVLADTAEIETREPDLNEPMVTETTETATVERESRIDVSSITNYDEQEPLVETEKEAEKAKEIEPVAAKEMSIEKITDSEDIEPLSKVLALNVKSTSDEESMSIDDLLAKILADMMLPSITSIEHPKIM